MINEKDLPDGWRLLNLRDVCINKGEYGSGASAIEYDENKPRYIRITDIDENGLLKKTSNVSPSIVEDKYFLNDGDLLFARSGSVGKTYLYNKKDGFCQYAGYLIRFKPDLSLIDSNYLSFLTKTPYYWNWIDSKKKILTIPNINAKQYSELKIPLPPLPTQKKIVAILEKAEKLKGWRREADELTDELLKSTFLEMFGDPVKNPNEWDIKKLGDICTLIKDGPHVSPNYTNKGIPFITVHNIINGFFDLSNVRYISETDHNEFCRRCKPEKGDVLYTKGGTTGFAKRIEIDFEFSIWVHLALLKFPKELLNDVFLEACLNSNYCKVQAKRYTRGIANRDLVLSQIAKIKMIVPPIEIQQKFADFVEKIELMQEHQTQSRQHINNLFNALMQQAFRGELS